SRWDWRLRSSIMPTRFLLHACSDLQGPSLKLRHPCSRIDPGVVYPPTSHPILVNKDRQLRPVQAIMEKRGDGCGPKREDRFGDHGSSAVFRVSDPLYRFAGGSQMVW